MTVPLTQKSIVVAEADVGERLDRVLARHVAELSRSRLKALIEAGAAALDGRTIRDPSHRVNSGATIHLDVPAPQPARPAPEPIPLDVVYEDDDIIVIDKPRNLVVHPAAGHWTGTLVNALIAHCGASLSGIGGGRASCTASTRTRPASWWWPRTTARTGRWRRNSPTMAGAASRSSAATSP